MMEIDHSKSHTPSDSTQSVLTVSSAIKMEHERQHSQLEAAVATGGKTGMHASEVAAILPPAFRARRGLRHALIMHAQNEEQVLYPATLVIGEYLKLQPAGCRDK